MKKIFPYFLVIFCSFILFSCDDEPKTKPISEVKAKKKPPILKEFGFSLNDYKVVKDTIRLGDSFGGIMDSNGVSRGKVFQISEQIKDIFNPARIVAGRAYTILKSKDTSETVQAFIYQQDKINYTVIDLQDSVVVRKDKKPVTIKRKTASGVITSSLSAAMDNEGLSILLADKIADIYQWKIDFFKIQKGDKRKR